MEIHFSFFLTQVKVEKMGEKKFNQVPLQIFLLKTHQLRSVTYDIIEELQ